MKTNKSYSKRIRVTRNGKLVSRKPGQDHFNAKESHGQKARKGRSNSVKMNNADRARFLAGS